MDAVQLDLFAALDKASGIIHRMGRVDSLSNVRLRQMMDTDVSYVGGAETMAEYESIDVDKTRFYKNPDSGKKLYFTYGVRLRVAKYKGRLFFARTVYFWDGFSSCHVFVDKDFELENNFKQRGEKPPEHTYRTSPYIDIDKGKDAIAEFAIGYLMQETRTYKMQKFIDEVIRLFKEDI